MKLVTMKRLYARLDMLQSLCQMTLQSINVYKNSRSMQEKSHSIRVKLIGPRLKQWLLDPSVLMVITQDWLEKTLREELSLKDMEFSMIK